MAIQNGLFEHVYPIKKWWIFQPAMLSLSEGSWKVAGTTGFFSFRGSSDR